METYIIDFLLLVPAIPFDTLTQLQETDDGNISSDFFQNVDLDKVQFIEEVNQSIVHNQVSLTDESNFDNENIPDIEDFEGQNILLTNDPVNFIH